MIRYYWLLMALVLLNACRNKEAGPVTLPGAIVEKSASPVLFNNTGIIDSGSVVYYALGGTAYEDGSFSSSRDYSASPLWNILFVNTRTGEQYLLGTAKMLIRNMDAGSDVQKQEPKAYPCIFYEMITDDRNKDKEFDPNEDPVYLFASDRAGKNLRRLSPPGHTLLGWTYVKAVNKVYMTVKADSNKDGKFDGQDAQMLYEASLLAQDAGPAPLLNNALQEQISGLYERDWRKGK